MKKIEAVGTVARMWCNDAPAKFLDSLAQLLIYEQSKLPKDKYIHYTQGHVSWHELGRNKMASSIEGDWILMLDTDHCFAPDLLERLQRIAKNYNSPVVSAIYQYKFSPHNPVMNMWEEDPEKRLKVRPIVDWDKKAEAIRVGCCGSGAMLIYKEVFERIANELHEEPFRIIPGLSEDYSFCWRCKKLDIPVLVATQVEAHHLLSTVLSIRDYVAPNEGIEMISAPTGVLK